MNRCVAYIVAVAAILCCLLGDSCSRKEEFHPELSISVGGRNLSASSLNYEEAGGSDVIQVKSNADWRVDCNADWLMIDPRNGGIGENEVRLSVGKSDKSRSCVVTISMCDMGQV